MDFVNNDMDDMNDFTHHMSHMSLEDTPFSTLMDGIDNSSFETSFDTHSARSFCGEGSSSPPGHFSEDNFNKDEMTPRPDRRALKPLSWKVIRHVRFRESG